MKSRQQSLWLLMVLICLAVFASVAFGQPSRALIAGTPRTDSLNLTSVTQIYTFDAAGPETIAISTVNALGVPLIVTVSDASAQLVAQAVDTGVSGELVLSNVALPAAGTYYIIVLKAGNSSSAVDVEFTIVVDVLADGTEVAVESTELPEATTAPESTTAANGTTDTTLQPVTQVLTTSGVQVKLDWNTTDDLDLEVRDPVGGSLYWRTPQVASGGTLSPNINQGCAVATTPASETASWPPGGVNTGSYEVIVYFQQSCNNNTAAPFTLTITVDGNVLGPIEATLNPGEIYVVGFSIEADGSASLNNDGGVVQSGILPASAGELLAAARPIAVNDVIVGAITNDLPYQVFSFEAASDILYGIDVAAISGSLDTYLALIDGSGSIDRENDDLAVGITNSGLSNVLLPNAGTYYLVVSRYAKTIGATEGEFQIALTAADIDLPDTFTESITPGSLQVLLVWNTNADLQLLVRDPAGDAVYDDSPSIPSGGELLAFGNVNCTQSEGAPYSYIVWPLTVAPRAGSYEVEVWYQNDCDDLTPVTFNLYVLKDGQTIYTATGQPLEGERFLTSFSVAVDGSATPGPGGIIRGLEDINFQPEVATAPEIVPNVPVTGTITLDNRFDVFVFNGTALDVVNIAMNNTSGTLDPSLILVGPTGVALASNDDAVSGENINSLIANFTLPADGQYIIIATHYGGPYGGTTGTYQLTLSQLN